MTGTERTRTDRRRFLRGLAAAAGGAAVLGGAAGPAAAQESANVVLDGETPGWVGRHPSSIDETKNPTLTLRAGATYALVWENVDGVPHNVVIEDEGGNNLVRTELVSDRGALQRVEFTASEEMVHYYCQVHPGSMSGTVEVVPADSEEGIDPAETTAVTPAATTATPTTQATATTTAAPTETATTAPTETTSAPAETTASGGQPGFGLIAGAGALAALVAARIRR